MHRLLQRQLEKYLGDDAKTLPTPCRQFLDAVDAAYKQADEDFALLERAMDLASEELLGNNAKLRSEIRDREKAEHEIQMLIRRNQLILDSAGEGILGLDQTGVVTSINPEACHLLEYGHDELLGSNFCNLVFSDAGPEDNRERATPVCRTLKQGIPQRKVGGVFRKKSGASFPVELSVIPMREGDTLTGVVITFQDVTERENYEKNLKTLNSELETRVQRRTLELERANNQQRQEILVRKQVESELRKATQDADKANRAKSEFLSRMSHELRTPLNAILGFGQLLGMDTSEPLSDSQRNRLVEILNAANHLLNLINEVLDLARIESGKLEFTIEPVHLSQIVSEVIPLVQTQATEAGIELSENLSANTDLMVMSDAKRLKQIFINLLSNAIKYNRPQGKVRVEFESVDSKRVRINIADTGLGIPEELQDKLFEPFQRLNAESTGIEGTGIGLAITKDLLESMQGGIIFKSAVGSGTCFTIELPLYSKSQELCFTPVHTGPEENAAGEVSHLVLYVEDNILNTRIVEEALAGHPTIKLNTVMTAEEGLEWVGNRHPDLILMDIQLPGMDGVTAMKMLKADEATREIPIVALSANASEIKHQAASLQFCEYINKPINIPLFLNTLDLLLKTPCAK